MGTSSDVSRIHFQNATGIRKGSYNVELETLNEKLKSPGR